MLVGGFQSATSLAGRDHRGSGDSGDLSTRLLLAKTAIAVKAELYCRWRYLCSVEWLGLLPIYLETYGSDLRFK